MPDQTNILKVGTILSGRYEILRVIGHGGFGTVYKARQMNMNRDVAVKVLPSEFLSMENVVERFRREAKLASRLSHPNTITLFDYGRDGQSLFIVMELLHGKDLADLLQEIGSCPPRRVVKIMSQVLRSLREAHTHGIVHRDLKPENIFVSTVSGEEDVVKVLDFGIAQFASPDLDIPPSASRPGGSPRRLTRTGSTIGTPAYMSPEQAAGDHLTNRSDLYSLGVIMYELVSGRLPFPGDDMIKTMRAHLFEDVPPIDVPGVTGTSLESVIMKALEKEPDDRFADAEEMLRALEGDPDSSSLPPFHSGKFHGVAQPLAARLSGQATLRATDRHPGHELLAESLAYADTPMDVEPLAKVSMRKVLSFNRHPFTVMHPVEGGESLIAQAVSRWDWTGVATQQLDLPQRHRPRGGESTMNVTLLAATIFLFVGAVVLAGYLFLF